ncbi:hypothetical protein CBR_g176 [Chara braunii]|uniref:Uncharacterized protein n=1 Tax=Chara braunii TaxID=69332 RepID=A0A388JLT2_CHABU|nr:hypothetical protein CBR_g176 [Chara braunii]|eukprot:GBG58776.1 hypothetical protein CBR_g176 [Chara braunii]
MQRRLPLLVLVVIVFLFVVFLHVCLSCQPWKQHRKRRASIKRQAGERPMAGMQARAVLAAGLGGRRPATAELPRWYDPSMYTHLESWEMPLPPSDEESETEELSTLPLASGAMQLFSQTVRAGGSASNEGGEFTSLLHQGLGDDDDGGLDLRFGLCSGSAWEASRTFIINVDPSPRGLQHAGSEHMDQSTLCGGAFITGGVGPSPAARQHGSTTPSADRLTSTCPARTGVPVGSLLIGGARPSMPNRTTPTQPDLRDEGARIPPVLPGPTVENITRGVSNMRAHSDGGDDDGGGGDDADKGFREDVEARDDDDDIPIWPLGKTGGRGRGHSRGVVRGRSVGRGGRGGVNDDDRKSATYSSSEDQTLLVRCKRQRTAEPRLKGGVLFGDCGRGGSGVERGGSMAARDRCDGVAKGEENAVVVHLGSDDDEPLDKRRQRTLAQGTPAPAATARAVVDERRLTGRLPATPSQPRQRNPGDDGGSVQRGGGGEVMADTCAVGGEPTGAAGAGTSGTVAPFVTAREAATVVVAAREEARGENRTNRDGGEPGSSRAFRPSERRPAQIHHEGSQDHRPITAAASDLPCGAMENIARHILHGWVFKSGNRPRGYNVAFQYSLESIVTDIARAMWYGEEWCNVVSATVCAQMIDLSMDLPLWFADTNIEDRPEDDDMAAYQESTVMAGDDLRSHYKAFYFANLVAKPTLVASMHRSFDHRRSFIHAAKVVTERLGKANATFREYPDYIPRLATCGIGFGHGASITGPEDAKKLDWLGSGPPDDDNNDDGKNDG